MTDITQWTSFLSAEVDATAALAGLIIVALSINLTRILAFRALVDRAAETLVMLVGALVIAGLGLVPEPIVAKGLEIAFAAAIVWVWPTVAQIVAALQPPGDERERPYLRFIYTQLTTMPALAGGVLLAMGEPAGLYWIAAGILLTLVAGVLNTWVLLVEILR